MAFSDYLNNPTYRSHVNKSFESENREREENYYRDTPHRRDESASRADEDDPDAKILREVDFYKERLYKKIDSCFVRYGLEGLRRIDEGIASSLADYIADLRGERRPSRQREEIRETAQEPQPQREFKKPVKIEEPGTQSYASQTSYARPQQPKSNDWKNDEVINKVLNDIIPPVEIHEVKINSNIPIDQIMAQRNAQNQHVELAPQPQMAEHISGDQMVEVQSGGEEVPVESVSPQSYAPQQSGSQKYDIVNDMLDKNTIREADSISMVVPPPIEEGDFDTGENWADPIEESSTVTPIDVPPAPRKKNGRKKKE